MPSLADILVPAPSPLYKEGALGMGQHPGVYASFAFEPQSEAALRVFVHEIGLPDPTWPLHVTTVYSRVYVPYKARQWGGNQLSVTPVGFAILTGSSGTPSLVLQLLSEALLQSHNAARDMGASWDFPDFVPHVTLAYDLPKDVRLPSVLSLPPLRLLGETVKPLEEDWKPDVSASQHPDMAVLGPKAWAELHAWAERLRAQVGDSCGCGEFAVKLASFDHDLVSVMLGKRPFDEPNFTEMARHVAKVLHDWYNEKEPPVTGSSSSRVENRTQGGVLCHSKMQGQDANIGITDMSRQDSPQGLFIQPSVLQQKSEKRGQGNGLNVTEKNTPPNLERHIEHGTSQIGNASDTQRDQLATRNQGAQSAGNTTSGGVRPIKTASIPITRTAETSPVPRTQNGRMSGPTDPLTLSGQGNNGQNEKPTELAPRHGRNFFPDTKGSVSIAEVGNASRQTTSSRLAKAVPLNSETLSLLANRVIQAVRPNPYRSQCNLGSEEVSDPTVQPSLFQEEMAMEQNRGSIKINGIVYRIQGESTPENEDEQGRPNLAREMRRYGIVRTLYLTRGDGHVLYQAHEYGSGALGKVLRLGQSATLSQSFLDTIVNSALATATSIGVAKALSASVVPGGVSPAGDAPLYKEGAKDEKDKDKPKEKVMPSVIDVERVQGDQAQVEGMTGLLTEIDALLQDKANLGEVDADRLEVTRQ